MENPPFEDVFAVENGGFPSWCSGGVRLLTTDSHRHRDEAHLVDMKHWLFEKDRTSCNFFKDPGVVEGQRYVGDKACMNSKRTIFPLPYVHTGTHPCHGCRDFLQEFLTKSLCVTSEASLNFRFSPRNFATRNPRLADEPTSEPLAMARQQGWTRRKSRYR